MKNMKEVQALLVAIFVINRTGQHDKDIELILDYAFRRLYGANTNMLMLTCLGKKKEQTMPEIMAMLEMETQYKKYLEEYKK